MKKRRKTKKGRKPRKVSFIRKIEKKFFAFFSFLKKQICGLPGKLKRYILSSLMFSLSFICFLSFFNLAGRGGRGLQDFFCFWIGNSIYIIPLIFVLFGLIFLMVPKRLFFSAILASLAILVGVSGIFSLFDSIFVSGGKIGDLLSKHLENLFGNLVAFFVFFTSIIVGGLSFWHLFSSCFLAKAEKENFVSKVIRKVIAFPRFEVSKIEPEEKVSEFEEGKQAPEVFGPEVLKPKTLKFTPPPLELLEPEVEKAHSGNLKQNVLIIKKTLENFGIGVTMAQVNVGPTVTQYTLKPAEGVRLSKITTLSNNLALALAAHPIRIEAPIPGKSLLIF